MLPAMQIASRPPLPPGIPAQSPSARRERPDNDGDDRRRPAAGAEAGRPAERILQGEVIDDAATGPRDRVNPWQQVDPANRPAIMAYEQMQTVSPRPGREAGAVLDLFA